MSEDEKKGDDANKDSDAGKGTTPENKNADEGGDASKDAAGDKGADKAGKDAPADDGKSGDGKDGAEGNFRPDGLPDHLIGKSDRETLELLSKAYVGARKTLGDVPKSPDGYKIEITDEEAKKQLRVGDDGKDPAMELAKKVAHKHGLSQEKFSGFVVEFLSGVGAAVPQLGDGAAGDMDVGFSAYGGTDKAKPVQDAVTLWAGSLKSQGKITDAVAAEINVLSQYGEGLKVLEAFRTLTGEKPIPSGGPEGPSEAFTREELTARVQDERYWTDPAFRKETEQGFEKLYGAKK